MIEFDAGELPELRAQEGQHHRQRIGEPGGLDHEVVDPAVTGKNPEDRIDEIVVDRAADAAVFQLHHVVVGGDDQLAVDAEFAELVDDDGGAQSVLVGENVLHQRGFSAAEKAGDDGHGQARLGRMGGKSRGRGGGHGDLRPARSELRCGVPVRRLLERDDFSSSHHPALAFCLCVIFSENRCPLFGITQLERQVMSGVEGIFGADRGLAHGIAEGIGERVQRAPTRAMPGDDVADPKRPQSLHGVRNDPFHDAAEMQAAHHAVDRYVGKQVSRVRAHIDDAGVGAGAEHDQAEIADVYDQHALVHEQRIGRARARRDRYG